MSRHKSLQRAFVLIAALAICAPSALAKPGDAMPPDRPTPPVANVVPDVIAVPPAPINLVESGGGYVAAGGVGTRAARQIQTSPKVATEQVAGRTEYSTVVANPDGTFTQTLSLGRINFRNQAGSWQPIDVSLVSRTVDQYEFQTQANDVDLHVSKALGADHIVELAAGDYRVRIRVPGLGAGTITTAADRISFAGVGADPGFEIIPTPEGFEFRVVIGDATKSNTFHVALQAIGLTTQATPDGTIWLVTPAGARIGFISAPTVMDAAGEIAPAEDVTTTVDNPGPGAPVRGDLPSAPATAPDPTATAAPNPTIDPSPTQLSNPSDAPLVDPSASPAATASSATPAPEPSSDPTAAISTPSPAPAATPGPTASPDPAADTSGLDPKYNVVRTDEVVVSYAIDPAWLAAPKRAFPVRVDPSVCIEYGTGTGCTGDTGTRDVWITLAQPNLSPTAGPLRAGYDGTTYSTTRSEIYFPDVALGDGAVITSASLQVTTQGNYSNRTLDVAPLSQPWPFGNGTWNNQPAADTTKKLQFTPPAVSGGAAMNMDVSPIVRGWYSRNPASWSANSGVKLWLDSELTSCISTDPCYRMYFYALDGTATQRPKLTINYLVHQARVDFDGSLGSDFAPATMPAGATIHLPVTLKNDGSGFSFPNCAGLTTNCYKVGYRWFDSVGKLATGFTASGTADLAASLASGSTSATIDLSVLAPPNVGQYTLRLDLVWMWNAATVFASDFADPSLYFARVKDPLAQPTNVRWVGTSNIARADYPVSIVAGAGTGIGETKSVSLPDGGSLGVNLYSKNLHFDGSGGVEFADLGTSVSLDYYYDSALRTDCTSSILGACGWGTNYDEGLLAGANGADYIYRDPSGNRFAVDQNADAQLVSGANVRLERYRATLIEENNLTGWSGGTVSPTTAQAYAGTSSVSISTSAATSTSTSFRPVDLSHFIYGSFAVKATGATGVAIGFRITNTSTGVPGWLYYTLGTDFAVAGVTKIALGGSIASWDSIAQRNVLVDAYSNGFGSVYDAYQVDGIALLGNGSAGTAYFDSVRFEGRSSQIYSDLGGGQPIWSLNGGNATANTTDKVFGANSLQIAPTTIALSPTCGNCLNGALDPYPYLRWAWKKVGGTTIAYVLNLTDARTGAPGTLTYYAGPVAPSGAINPIQVASTIPDHWIYVTRNVLEDARQVLGFYDDHDTSGTSTAPSLGPTPDHVLITGYALVAADGAYALFDDSGLRSLPNLGPQWLATTGDEFAATYPGGVVHHFDREGRLISITDLDANQTQLVWAYDATHTSEALTKIITPADGQALSAGTAQREIAVSTQSTYVSFTEQLGSTSSYTGRVTQFTRTTGGDVSAIIPARHVGACGVSPAVSGCALFMYVAGHYLSRVDDPRSTGSNSFTSSITWTSGAPTKITANASPATDLFRVISWDAAADWHLRPEYEDANGVTTGTNGYARYDDLSPNGSVLTEYAPVACTAANCTSAPAAGDKLVSYTVDGIDNYATETHYRTTGTTNPVTTRRGTLAAAKVDNFADPLTAGLTAWTQTAGQYAASVAAGNVDLYRTNLTYNELGRVTHEATPYTNPAGGVSTDDTLTLYDAEGHVIQTSDSTFLADPGFEGQLVGWSGTGTWTQTSPATGVGALALAGAQTEYQTALLLPGETFRFQAAVKAAAGSAGAYKIDYEKPGGTYASLLPLTTSAATTWTTISYDVSIPQDGTGRVKVTFSVNGGSGSAFVDDVAIFTHFDASTYLANGRLDTSIDVLGRVTKAGYAASTVTPAIFPTTATANYVSGGGSSADQNVVTTSAYDAWGRVTATTDPDGVTTDSVYATNKTDVATVHDGLGNATAYLYDEDGNRTSVDDPVHPPATTTFTFFGDPLDVTGSDGVVTRYAYDGAGRQTSVTANFISGGGVTGVNNVATTETNDQYGNVTRTVGDAAGGLATSDVYTDLTFDLLGQAVSTTVYENGTSTGPRTTTAYFDSAGRPAASRGPINPTAAASPTCPGSANKCNSVATLDMNGRATDVTDAYGKTTRTWYDFAGKTVREIQAYVDGVYSTADPAHDIITTSRYDPADHLVAITDVLGNTTSTAYDHLDRVIQVTRADSSWVKTVYLASGRVDRVSRPGAAGQSDTQVGWTKNLYDAAGRQTTTIADYDTTGAAQYQLDPFEDTDMAGWSAASGSFINTGATLASYDCTTTCATGGRAASVTTTSVVTYEGATWTLTGTFKSGQTYKASLYARASSSMTIGAYVGKSSAAGQWGSSGPVVVGSSWVRIDVTWTNTTGADVSTAYLAVRTESAQAGTFYLDDVQVWDPTTPTRHAPTITAFDAAGQVVATVAPPDIAGDPPMVTTSGYDNAGRLTSVTVNAIDGATPANDVNLTTTKVYDSLGDLTDETDPSGVKTHYGYDRGANVTATTLNWDGVGLNVTNTINVTSKVGYNDRGETTVICAAQQVQSDACDPVAGTGLTFGWRYTYDAAGHVATDTPPDNAGTDLVTTTNTYDTANGGARLASSCDALSGGCSTPLRHTDLTYDDLGRTTQSITYLGTGTGTPKLRTVTTFDGASERTGLDFYENGSGTASDSLVFGFDSLGRETTITRSGSPVTTTTYNPDGSAATRIDHAISSTAMAFGYDLRGNLTSSTSPLMTGSVTYAWRLDGLLASRSWPTGTNTGAFAYDGAKRPTQLAETASAVNLAVFGRTYDKNGTVTSETQTVTGISGDAGGGTQTFTNDPLRRVTGATLSGSGTTKAYTYDANSNRVSQTEGGYTSTTTYERTGVPASITVDGYTTNDTIDSYGNVLTAQVATPLAPDTAAPSTPTGLTATGNGRTRADLVWSPSSDNVGVTSYSIYRDAALVMTVAGSVTAWSDFSLSSGTTYAYTIVANDAAGNASSTGSASNATTANGSTTTDSTAPSVPTGVTVTVATSKQLDVAWAASTDNVGVQGYRVYRDSTLVATVGTNAFSDVGLGAHSSHTYTVAAIDGSGNASAQSSGGSGTTAAPDRATTYAYDLADRLTGITPTTGPAVTLTLDALGRHRTRTSSGATDTYSYAGESQALVRIASSTGTSTSSVVDATGGRLATSTSAGGFGWSLSDLHGDVAGYVAGAGGVVTDANRYDPFGEVVNQTSSGLASPWGFQGRLDLASTGDTDLLDFGFRPYVPDLGLFTSPDDQAGSALNPLSFNRYLYAGANPETLVDPDGHCWGICISLPDIAGVVASIGIAAATAVVAGTVGLGAVAAGAVAGAAASVASDVISGRGVRWESAVSGAVGGAAFVGALAVTHNIAAAGFVAGAAGDAVSQGINIAEGHQKSFNGTELAISAGAGAAFAWGGNKVATKLAQSAGNLAGRGVDKAVDDAIALGSRSRWDASANRYRDPITGRFTAGYGGRAAAANRQSPGWSRLYELVDQTTGAHQKWGITAQEPMTARYGGASHLQRQGLSMIPGPRGPTRLMRLVERALQEVPPGGPMANEPWAGGRTESIVTFRVGGRLAS